MAGSRLKESLGVIYAPNYVDNMLARHSYFRAIREHILAQLALSKIILKRVNFTNEK